jgi:hypothetical protein
MVKPNQRLNLQPPIPTGVYQRAKVEDLRFDSENPRLAEFAVDDDTTQSDLLKKLWQEMAVQEVAASIAHNGYFEHEPLFVESRKDGKLVVIEGNRRLAAVRLLLDRALRDKLKATDLPTISSDAAEALRTLPVIVTTRKEAWRYLGFKHVNGPAPWGSYAKAQYIAHVHNEYGVPLDQIAAQIGDYTSLVRRMYRGLMIVEQAEKSGVFDRAGIAKSKFHFNYIYTGMDYPGIQSFLGLELKGTSSDKPVPAKKVQNLGQLMKWLYGERSGKPSLIKSQNPDLKNLDRVLQSEQGIRALRDGLPLYVALDISLGDEKIFVQALQQGKAALQRAYGTLPTGYSSNDVDSLKLALTIEQLAGELVDAMRTKHKRNARENAAVGKNE